MTMAFHTEGGLWLFRLSRLVRLSMLMAFPFPALEPEQYRKMDWAGRD